MTTARFTAIAPILFGKRTGSAFQNSVDVTRDSTAPPTASSFHQLSGNPTPRRANPAKTNMANPINHNTTLTVSAAPSPNGSVSSHDRAFQLPPPSEVNASYTKGRDQPRERSTRSRSTISMRSLQISLLAATGVENHVVYDGLGLDISDKQRVTVTTLQRQRV